MIPNLNEVTFPSNCSDTTLYNCARIAVEDFDQNKTCVYKKQERGLLSEILTMQSLTNQKTFVKDVSMFFKNSQDEVTQQI